MLTKSENAISVQDRYLGRRIRYGSFAAAMLLIVAATFGFWRVSYHGQVSRFFHIGDPRPIPTELIQSGAYIYHGQDGYDGRFFLTLATDPLLSRPSSIAMLDDPVYRARRILLPAIVFALSGGRPLAAQYVFVAINVVAFAALLWLLASLAGSLEAEPWAVAIGLCSAGTWVALLFGTAELLEGALLLSAFSAYRASRYAAVAGALALAMLCRETSALVFAAFVATALIRKERLLAIHLSYAWIPAAAWNATVWARHHGTGAVLGHANFDWPLLGAWHALLNQRANAGASNELFWVLSIATMIGVAGTLAWYAKPIMRADLPLALAVFAYAALFACAGRAILEYHLGFDRAFLPLFLLTALGLLESRHRSAAHWLIVAQGCITLTWLLHFGLKELRLA